MEMVRENTSKMKIWEVDGTFYYDGVEEKLSRPTACTIFVEALSIRAAIDKAIKVLGKTCHITTVTEHLVHDKTDLVGFHVEDKEEEDSEYEWRKNEQGY